MRNRHGKKLCCLSGLLLALAVSSTGVWAQRAVPSRAGSSAGARGGQEKTRAPEQEQLVHLAYLKLSFYNRVANAMSARLRERAHRTTDDLRFRLERFRRGPIEEIYDTSYTQLVTKPTGEILHVTTGVVREQTEGGGGEGQVSYPVQWGRAPYAPEDWERATLRDVLRATGRLVADIKEYVSFEVEARLQGKSRRYRALALFYGGADAAEAPKVEIIDNIAGIGGLMTNLLYEGRTPAGGNAPVAGAKQGRILGFITAAERAAGADTPLVCDYERGRCCWRPGFNKSGGNLPLCDAAGRPEESRGALLSPVTTQLRAALNYCNPGGGESCRFTRTEKPDEKIGQDSTNHVWGQHTARIEATGFCQTTANCYAECDHDNINIAADDIGFPSTSCHVYYPSHERTPYNGSYSPSNPPSCSIKAEVKWKACSFCWCSGSPFPGINLEVVDLWTMTYESSFKCSGN